MTSYSERIDHPGTLYRVGLAGGAPGLWYDAEGRETGIIHTIPGAAAAALPMGPNPIFRVDGRHWISATDTFEGLRNWFSRDDMSWLVARSYEIMAIEVRRYRRLFFESYQHEVYCAEDVRQIRIVPAHLLYPDVSREIAA